MCNWFQSKSPTHTFAVGWDTWHGNWAAPCYFNGASPTGSPQWGNCLLRHLACDGLYTLRVYVTIPKCCVVISDSFCRGLNMGCVWPCSKHKQASHRDQPNWGFPGCRWCGGCWLKPIWHVNDVDSLPGILRWASMADTRHMSPSSLECYPLTNRMALKKKYIDGSVWERRNCSALAIELRLSNPSICTCTFNNILHHISDADRWNLLFRNKKLDCLSRSITCPGLSIKVNTISADAKSQSITMQRISLAHRDWMRHKCVSKVDHNWLR